MARRTRFDELQFARIAPGVWRIVDAETGHVVGPHYGSRAELLADLERFAAFFGCEGTIRAPQGGGRE